MRLLFAALFMFSFSLISFGQIDFEQGYIITNEGKKVDCLIKNVDWRYNPTEIEYKLTDASEVNLATIAVTKEFGINNISKYVRFDVKVDRSSDELNKLTTSRSPDFKNEKLFLKVLVEGNASLYVYEESSLLRFFYKKKEAEIKQLVYKRYKVTNTVATNDSYVASNDMYKQQILNNLNCQLVSTNKIKSINYQKGDLTNYFVKENECLGGDITNFEEKVERDAFNLTIRPGINYSTMEIFNSNIFLPDVDFGGAVTFRFGIETEFILPFNKNKWSLFLEPTYQYFKGEEVVNSNTITTDYQSIELPLGIRYYMFFSESSKLFLNGAILYDFPIKSEVNFSGTTLEIDSKTNFAFGLGYKVNRFSAELRFLTNRQLFNNYQNWTSKYYTYSAIIGYTLF